MMIGSDQLLAIFIILNIVTFNNNICYILLHKIINTFKFTI